MVAFNRCLPAQWDLYDGIVLGHPPVPTARHASWTSRMHLRDTTCTKGRYLNAVCVNCSRWQTERRNSVSSIGRNRVE
eukprot:419696-Amphidinium_carterae.1